MTQRYPKIGHIGLFLNLNFIFASAVLMLKGDQIPMLVKKRILSEVKSPFVCQRDRWWRNWGKRVEHAFKDVKKESDCKYFLSNPMPFFQKVNLEKMAQSHIFNENILLSLLVQHIFSFRNTWRSITLLQKWSSYLDLRTGGGFFLSRLSPPGNEGRNAKSQEIGSPKHNL